PSLALLVKTGQSLYFPKSIPKIHSRFGTKQHMRWFKGSLRHSIYGLLGNPVLPSESVLLTGTEDIREAMLSLLTEAGTSEFPSVTRRVRYGNDIRALWYLRGDLLAALAAVQGEQVARQKVQRITRMFQGLLPGSLNSRPSSLMN